MLILLIICRKGLKLETYSIIRIRTEPFGSGDYLYILKWRIFNEKLFEKSPAGVILSFCSNYGTYNRSRFSFLDYIY